MKKIIALSSLLLFMSSCVCVIGQVPPQYLYVDESCGAALPDYIPKLKFSDNCAIDTVEQTPTAGTWLTSFNPTVTVLVRAKDAFGNKTDMMFTVTLLDTIPPTIELLDSSLISNVYDQMNTVYDIGDRMLARQELWFDATFDYEAQNIPPELIPANQYANKMLVTWTSPLLAFTGAGFRMHTFVSQGDTLIIR